VKSVLALRAAGVAIHGMAHITGGGLVDNLPRCIPDGLNAEILLQSWPEPAVFAWLRDQADLTFTDAARIWNLGIGYVMVVLTFGFVLNAGLNRVLGVSLISCCSAIVGHIVTILKNQSATKEVNRDIFIFSLP